MKPNLFKNREIGSFLICIIAFCAAVSIALLFFEPILSLASALVFAVLILVFMIFTAKRYRRLAELSEDLDRLMNGDTTVQLAKYTEGELSILKNRIEKLVLRMRSQSDSLKKDKLLLADSIADISHQIKTPLTSINLLSTALAKQAGYTDTDAENDEMRKTLADMHSQINRMGRLVSALLKLARFDADAVEMTIRSVTLEEIISSAAEPLEIMFELKGQTLEVCAEGNVCCDALWTSEAVMNVLKNCSESMGEGVLRVHAAENPLYSEIIILDSGCGIDEDDIPHLFERFYRGKNASKEGVGIGLALARSIIVKQNGTIKAENAQGGGARFTIRFYKGTV